VKFRTVILDLATFVLGVVFMAAGWTKTRFPYEFLSDVYAYGVVSPEGGLLVAVLLPWVEIATGVFLIANVMSNGALVVSTLLCIVFVAVQSWALCHGLDIACGCFGDGGKIDYGTLIRTVGLLVVSVLALYGGILRERRHQ
jgi:uncharacterized membrane protein YphA (DoxX/SURF4 family)